MWLPSMVDSEWPFTYGDLIDVWEDRDVIIGQSNKEAAADDNNVMGEGCRVQRSCRNYRKSWSWKTKWSTFVSVWRGRQHESPTTMNWLLERLGGAYEQRKERAEDWQSHASSWRCGNRGWSHLELI